jgi:hypothetical protein
VNRVPGVFVPDQDRARSFLRSLEPFERVAKDAHEALATEAKTLNKAADSAAFLDFAKREAFLRKELWLYESLTFALKELIRCAEGDSSCNNLIAPRPKIRDMRYVLRASMQVREYQGAIGRWPCPHAADAATFLQNQIENVIEALDTLSQKEA